jgi:hypothetical protein
VSGCYEVTQASVADSQQLSMQSVGVGNLSEGQQGCMDGSGKIKPVDNPFQICHICALQ